MQFSAVQGSAVQCSEVHHSAVQCSAVSYSAVRCRPSLHSELLRRNPEVSLSSEAPLLLLLPSRKCLCTLSRSFTAGQTGPNRFRLVWTGSDQCGPVQTSADWFRPVRTGSEQISAVQTSLASFTLYILEGTVIS